MNLRLLRFLLVGGIGIGVQLGVLAGLVALRVHYLLATVVAVESAVLHNFLWHQRYTWADRGTTGITPVIGRLVRFHLSNGVISLLGNLLLMRLLVGSLGLAVPLANLFAIVVCFAANFLASEHWVFHLVSARSRISTRVRCEKGT